MTYKEYMWLVNPDKVNDRFSAGVYGCPNNYGLKRLNVFQCCGKNCGKCWSQELKRDVIAEVVSNSACLSRPELKVGEKFKVTHVDLYDHDLPCKILLKSGRETYVFRHHFKFYLGEE